MDIILAGFNIDTEVLQKSCGDKAAHFTPETFSAAYARISRSAKDVTALRREACADVEKARKSNQSIIFGMGHHSVAEHAVFNFDIAGVSRLAMEEIEKFRLASYTEKSQRYVTLDGDFIIPEELKNTPAQKKFIAIINQQNNFYQKAFETLKGIITEKYNSNGREIKTSLIEGEAKEDARYAISLATEGQLGLTANGREIEHMLRRFNMSALKEVREAGKIIQEKVMQVAPSIILFTTPSAFENKLAEKLFSITSLCEVANPNTSIRPVLRIVSATPEADNIILAAMAAAGSTSYYEENLAIFRRLSFNDKEKIYRDFFTGLEFFDHLPREFEMAEITFEAVVSASCYAQLKRHRMATPLTGPYNPQLGWQTPPAFTAAGLTEDFNAIMAETAAIYNELKQTFTTAADYVLTNAFRRKVLMKMNLREAYHFGRLRQDAHAQWEIRNMANTLAEEIKKYMPLSAMLLCGKSDYAGNYNKIFNAPPAHNI